ncbi:MAG: hypothetical protein KJ606_13500 [Chloroflexi bacterium]|nr:hypothetical protein [Chloroflexota bacterium]
MVTVTEKNLAFHDKLFDLIEQFHHYVFSHPDVLDKLPEKAALVLLDAEDEEFNRRNIELAKNNRYPEDVPIVYVRMTRQVRMIQQIEWTPSIVSSPLAV